MLNESQWGGRVGDESVLREQFPVTLERGAARGVEIEPDVLGKILLANLAGCEVLLLDDRRDVRDSGSLDLAERIRRRARDIGRERPQGEDERKSGAAFPLLTEV